MAVIHVTNLDGSEVTVEGKNGLNLMEALSHANIAGIEAICGGGCSCATCHVHIDADWTDTVGPRGDIEDELVSATDDFEEGTSRLSCQVEITDALDGLKVKIAEPE